MGVSTSPLFKNDSGLIPNMFQLSKVDICHTQPSPPDQFVLNSLVANLFRSSKLDIVLSRQPIPNPSRTPSRPTPLHPTPPRPTPSHTVVRLTALHLSTATAYQQHYTHPHTARHHTLHHTPQHIILLQCTTQQWVLSHPTSLDVSYSGRWYGRISRVEHANIKYGSSRECSHLRRAAGCLR